MKFDDIIQELGEFGPYQKRIYYLMCLIGIPAAFRTMSVVFTLATPDHRCALPGLPNDTYEMVDPWHKDNVDERIPWSDDDEGYSKCKLYYSNETTNQIMNQTYKCSKWVYSKTFFESTFTSDLDLVCDDTSLSTYANMIYMSGMLAGAPVLGTLSDIIGRKKVMMLGIIGTFVATLSTAFITSYIPFVILRFITAWIGSAMFLSAFVIGMEMVGPSKRKIAGIVIEIFWCFGLYILALLAYLIRDWRTLQIATSIPTFAMICVACYIPESPRWLITKRRYKEANRIIQKAATVNKVKLSDRVSNLEKLEEEGPGEKVWEMFKSPVLLVRCLVIFFNWNVASLVYYGLSLNVGALSGNIYLNFSLSSLVEGASYVFCLLFLDRFGRKFMQCFSMILAGVACLCTMFPVMYGNHSVNWITVALSLVGKFGASAAFAVIYVFSAELFPTAMRNSGMGFSSFSARIAGIIAPYIADLGKIVKGNMGVALPLIIFGGSSLAAGLLALLLPETVGRVLPETVEDAKNFGREKQLSKQKEMDAMPYDVSNEHHHGNVNPAFSTNI